MEAKNLEKALDIVSKLILGEEIAEKGSNAALYQEYSTNGEVYDIVYKAIGKMNLKLYEYHNTLYISPGDNSKVFGYSNEELRREIGVRNNKELYLAYFIIYNVLSFFYQSSDSSTYCEFVRLEEMIAAVDAALSNVLDKKNGVILEEIEERSFRQIAMSWEELPVSSQEDASRTVVSRNSKAGFVKLVLQFMVKQELLVENVLKYYPTNRFRALAENYFEESGSHIYEIMGR